MEFVCTDPNAQVRAANVLATLTAMQSTPNVAQRMLTRYGLKMEELTEHAFVRLQTWLDMLRDLQSQAGFAAVRRVGRSIIEKAEFPANFTTVESVLRALDGIYYLNHRGDVGHYRVRDQENGRLVIRCETPYPRHFERGLIEGICANPRGNGFKYGVKFEEGPAHSACSCVLTVQRTAEANQALSLA